MRIVIDLQGAQTESRYRGIGRYTISIAKAIIRNNTKHEIFIALSSLFPETIADLKKQFSEYLPAENIVVWHAPGPVRALERDNAWRSESAEYIREVFLHNLRPDIVFITSLFEGHVDNAVTSIAKFSSNTKVAVLHHDLIPLVQSDVYLQDDAFKEYYLKKINWLKNADLILTNSDYTSAEAIEWLDVPFEKVHTVSAATEEHFVVSEVVDAEFTALKAHYGITRDVVLYAPGGFDSRKNFRRLIEAYSKLSPVIRDKHQLVIVSKLSDSDRSGLRTIANSARLREDEMILTGYVSEHDLVVLYQLSKLFVFASLHEGFGLPILEAMTCGAATIGSNVTSIPEVIGYEDALFDPYSVDSIKEKLHQALSDDAFLARLKQHATTQAKKFSWDYAGITALGCFENIIEDAATLPVEKVSAAQLVTAISSINCREKPTDNDLRATAESIDRNAKLIELHSVDIEKLSWRVEGPFDSSYSLALVNREFARALSQDNVEVLLHSTEGPGDFAPSETFINDMSNADLKEFHQRIEQQGSRTVNVLSRNLYPPRVSGINADVKLLHCYAWEETGFPQEWINNFNRELDAVLCTSEHVRKVLIDNGAMVPVFNVGNGCEHWDRIQSGAAPKLVTKKFKFLHVSSCFPRKGVQAMLAAYGAAFTSADDVSLIIKTFANPHNEVHQWLAEERAANANYPDLIIIEQDMAESDLKALYEFCDVLVAPSCAEGFGLPVAEAMLSGLPAITTNWSGQLDFCTPENSWLVDYKFERAKTHFGLFSSSWVSANVDDLGHAMKDAVESSEEKLKAMALKGRELIMAKFKWSDVAQRSTSAVANLRKNFELAHEDTRIGWLSTWNTKCGIATYSQHLVADMPSDQVVIFAPAANDLVGVDENNVLRCWVVGKENNYLDALDAQIETLRLNTLVIQFNYGFFNHRELSAFIEKHHHAGRVIVMAMHSTVDPEKEPHWNFRLSEMTDALKMCDRLLVHSITDINRLKLLGIVDNVTLFPHGVLGYPKSADKVAKPNALPLVASYGFCLPHKGLKELIEAVAYLKSAGKPVRLRLVNAEYPVSESADLVRELKATASKLGVEDLIEMYNDFLDDEESLRLLSDADVLVFAYQNTGESASGAVRYGMATHKPVAVTPLAIFDDLGDAVFRFNGTSVADIAEGISAINQKSPEAIRIQQRADEWRQQHDYHTVARRLENMCTGLLRAKVFK
ncbi:glycosyltransferase [Rouxiella sp. S1S-2]|uniref:glycosyltransferase n=1 Tax=Rouxiella sp. S1S-2 TaxID=2653856 RepID=UPI0012653052|nr:glycosyltransferase [Rouxiella sp. S1S-2]KAB7897081.1 glycosyltransferase [Rouxiella sp. S1S-2]